MKTGRALRIVIILALSLLLPGAATGRAPRPLTHKTLDIVFMPRVERRDGAWRYIYHIASRPTSNQSVDIITLINEGRPSSLLSPSIWRDSGKGLYLDDEEGHEAANIMWLPGYFIEDTRVYFPGEELPQPGPDMPPLAGIDPGQTSGEFGILASIDLPGIILWRVESWTPTPQWDEDRGIASYEDVFWRDGRLVRTRYEYNPETVDTATLPSSESLVITLRGQTVGPELNPDDMSLEQQLFRLQNLVEEAEHIGWIGEDAAEKLVDRARSARRKLFLRGAGGEHNAAAWAKLLQFRDDLRRAHEEWIEETREEREDWDRSRRVRRGREREEEEEIPFIPRYDDEPIDEDAADDRAWALLEPNVTYLLDRLAPPRAAVRPRRGEGRGPGGH